MSNTHIYTYTHIAESECGSNWPTCAKLMCGENGKLSYRHIKIHDTRTSTPTLAHAHTHTYTQTHTQ